MTSNAGIRRAIARAVLRVCKRRGAHLEYSHRGSQTTVDIYAMYGDKARTAFADIVKLQAEVSALDFIAPMQPDFPPDDDGIEPGDELTDDDGVIWQIVEVEALDGVQALWILRTQVRDARWTGGN